MRNLKSVFMGLVLLGSVLILGMEQDLKKLKIDNTAIELEKERLGAELIIACQNNDIGKVKNLIDSGANINQYDWYR